MDEIKPALMSVADAQRYLGGIGRTSLYVEFLPRLETLKVGRRRMITRASLDRLIFEFTQQQAEVDADREKARARYAKRQGAAS